MSVKILDITLKNFRRFYVGMNRKEVHIKFDKKYSTFMIKGDNGVGKSALLEELNPLPGIRRGYDIIPGEVGEKIVTFVGMDKNIYRVHYVYKPNKDGHTCQGDILKYLNGQKVSISENSSVTDTIMKIKTIAGIDNKLHKLSAIGIGADDRGIVSMSASARRLYLQEISPLGDTKELLKNVSEKYLFHKKSRESCELKLSGMPTLDSLTHSKTIIENSIKDLKDKQGAIFSHKLMSDEEYNLIKMNLQELQDNHKSCMSIQKIIDDRKLLTSVATHNERLNTTIATSRGKMVALKDNLLKLKQKLALISLDSVMDIDQLEKDIASHEFHKIDGVYLESDSDLRIMEIYYKNISDIMTDIIITHMPEGYTLHTLLNKSYEATYDEVYKMINRNKMQLEEYNELKKKNYVPNDWNIQRSSNCSDDSCPLYLKFKDVYTKIEKYEEILDDIQKNEIELERLSEELKIISSRDFVQRELEKIYDIIDSHSDILIKLTPAFESSSVFRNHILNNGVINCKDMLSFISYNTRIYLSYRNLLDEYNIMKNNNIVSINSDIANHEVEIEELNNIISDAETQVIPYSNQSSMYASYLPQDIKKEIDRLYNEIQSNNRIISVEEKNREDYNMIKNDIESINDNLSKLESELGDIKNTIFLYNHTVTELEKHTLEEQDTFIVRETLRVHLPIKILDKIVLELKERTNEFLDSTDLDYRVHSFNITPSEFTIKVKKGSYLNDDIGKMSNGELMIMTLATTLALNNIMLPYYNVVTLDEMDATLSATNRKKFLDIIMNFRLFKDLQMFIVSHNNVQNTQLADDIAIIHLQSKGNISVIPFNEYIL